MKRIISRLFGLALLCIFLVSCKNDSPAPAAADELPSIKDEYGRTLILHGLNTSSSAKYGNYLPWIMESDVEREATEFGFNFVRLLTSWVALEPEQGVYDEEYLNKYEERVNWYTSRGMYVMIDMHQDVYGAAVGGNGHPDWACITNGAPQLDLTGLPWWVKNIDPAVIACWKNFWEYKNYKFLQDRYVLVWQKLAERFKDNPYVIGYDLMNEPWGGDLAKVFLNGQFERNLLPAFYSRLIPGIRSVDPDKYIFFEPTPAPVTFGAKSNLSPIADTRPDKRLVYAPHCYPYGLHEGGPYTENDKKQLQDWERERRKDVKTHGGVPLMCGEFGLSPSSPGFDQYLADINAMFDRNQWSWTYWSNDLGGWSPLNADRSETPILRELIRTYPRATAGRLVGFVYDPVTDDFIMKFISNTAISQPTEIFIPNRHYPEGWKLSVSGTDNWSQSWDETKQVLSLTVTESGREVVVKIVPA